MKKKESEKVIERRLRDGVRQIGGKAIKILVASEDGLPDRIVLLPGGRAVFVETKSTGDSVSSLQRVQHGALRRLGFEVDVIDTVNGVTDFIVKHA